MKLAECSVEDRVLTGKHDLEAGGRGSSKGWSQVIGDDYKGVMPRHPLDSLAELCFCLQSRSTHAIA
jgi:hypothetical protein